MANSLISLEAAPGFEPGNNGFADRCLSHLAMPPCRLSLSLSDIRVKVFLLTALSFDTPPLL